MIVILGTSAAGGVRSVIQSYIDLGIYNNIGYKFIPTHHGQKKLFDFFIFLNALFVFLRIFLFKKPAAVHAHMTYNGSFWRKYIFFKISEFFHVPFICHLHGSEFKLYVNNSSAFRFKMIKKLATGSSKFLVLSKGWKKFVDENFSIESIVLSNFVDVPEEYLVKSYDNRGDIVFIGAFIERKGVIELINAFSRANLNCKLRLCGNGPLFNSAKTLVKQLDIDDKVIFHGWVSGKDKYEIMAQSSLFVLPTHNEGLPLTILEAFATKTFVISTSVGAIPEVVINNVNGSLVEVGNVDELKEKLVYFYTNQEERDSATDIAYDVYIKKFTSKVVIPILSETYKSCGVNLD